MHNQIIHKDCYIGLDDLDEGIIHSCITSPPYFGLRDYNLPPTAWPAVSYRFFGRTIEVPAMTCCLGLEKTPEQYVGHIVAVMRKVKRVLRGDGTLWLNLGDSYAATSKNRTPAQVMAKSNLKGGFESQVASGRQQNKIVGGLKEKDLIGIPWMVAFALREDGWYLRQDLIWQKTNPMPESVRDRCTKSHEYIFLLSKSKKYYFDQQAILKDIEPSVRVDKRLYKEDYQTSRPQRGFPNSKPNRGSGLLYRTSGNKERKPGSARGCPEGNGSNVAGSVPWEGMKANKRSVWTVSTRPFNDEHYAVFPEELIVDMVKAGCPKDGVVLDPFGGRGTTAIVAQSHDRNYVVFELSEKSVAIAKRWIKSKLGMFAKV